MECIEQFMQECGTDNQQGCKCCKMQLHVLWVHHLCTWAAIRMIVFFEVFCSGVVDFLKCFILFYVITFTDNPCLISTKLFLWVESFWSTNSHQIAKKCPTLHGTQKFIWSVEPSSYQVKYQSKQFKWESKSSSDLHNLNSLLKLQITICEILKAMIIKDNYCDNWRSLCQSSYLMNWGML